MYIFIHKSFLIHDSFLVAIPTHNDELCIMILLYYAMLAYMLKALSTSEKAKLTTILNLWHMGY